MIKHNARVASVTVLMITGIAGAAWAQAAGSGNVDRSAQVRISYIGAPAAYDPPFSKNQFQETAYMFPIYDSLVRLDVDGNIVPCLATSWEFSSDGLTLTMNLRKGVKFTDGSDLNADVVVKNLNRMKKDPASLFAGQLAAFDAFEAKDRDTVVLRMNKADPNVLYTLSTSVGMIVSGKALDDKVDLANHPVGSGPYKLVSSGPQGANYERNEDYFDKSQIQLAKASIIPIVDSSARLNAILTGSLEAGIFQADLWPKMKSMEATGNFKIYSFVSPNSMPMWLNTKIKPLDNPKVRQALTIAIDREGINQGIQNGQCQPAAQPLQPGVIGHDTSLVAPKRDVEKAKALLKEAGVGPFTIDTIVSVSEPLASVGVALKQQLADIGVTMNIIPTGTSAARPLFRAGNHGAMIFTLSVAAPDPASIIDALYMSPDNPGGVTPEFAKAVADARTKRIGSPEREAAYKAISKMAYNDPHQVFVCWASTIIVANKNVKGIEKEAYLNAVPIPDIRTYSVVKN